MGNGSGSEDKKKSKWDIVDIFVKPLGGLLTALAIAYLGHQFNVTMASQQMIDSRFRLYSELMSRREEAESNLRKDMFASIINSFLSSDKASIDSYVLNLELLTQNFHESLNIKPLFKHLERKICNASNCTEEERREYMERVYRVAREITRKQRVVLESHGLWFDHTVQWDTESEGDTNRMTERTMTLDGIERKFMFAVSEVDTAMTELEVSLVIVSNGENGDIEAANYNFGLGFFDFPMIDNIRLSADQRCAVVLNNFKDSSADITVLYFPGAYASLKERPYYQDVYEDLLISSAD